MTDITEIMARGKECNSCGGEGWTPGYTAEPACCMGSPWECGAEGCTGPVAMQVETQDQCEACGGSGTIQAAQEE